MSGMSANVSIIDYLFIYCLEKPGSNNNSSFTNIVKRIYRQNGIQGLFTGLTPRIIKVAPACAIMIASFEHGKRFFSQYNRALAYEEELKRNNINL